MAQMRLRLTAEEPAPQIVSSSPITLSLFSGAGGLDIGFHRAGFRIAACIEIDKAACQTLELNRGRYLDAECQILNCDIREVAPSDIRIKNFDFIIGGPPCQSFSAIGRRAGGVDGTQDQRGSLFEHYCRLVQFYQPQGFLFENVRGILGANKGEDWKQIVSAFAELGYQLSYKVLDSADYGVPQHRERLIMIGVRGVPVKFPAPTHGPDSPSQRAYLTAQSAIADLQDHDEPSHSYSGKYGSLLAEVPPGNNYHFFTREMGYPQPIFAWRSRFSDFLYKADPDKPVRTIVASLGAYSGPFHWKNRKFTIQEFKRLQTFPDDYEFAGGQAAMKQIGNSVPPIFAEQLARATLQQVFGGDYKVDLIEADEKLSFDGRKSSKARSTRAKRLINASNNLGPLFSVEEQANVILIGDKQERLWQYCSLRERISLTMPLPGLVGHMYRVQTERDGQRCDIHVSRYEGPTFLNDPLLRYTINFHQPIGDGLGQINCILLSNSAEDIAIAWDAIEDYLGACSGYQTMMDVYGHFTEPHPTFDLKLEALTSQPSFLLRFAQEFSTFEATAKVLPASVLQQIYGDEAGQDFSLTNTARYLRSLRFDVRVNETNPTIAPGYFRCCYPFTINVNKQISVAWRDSNGAK